MLAACTRPADLQRCLQRGEPAFTKCTSDYFFHKEGTSNGGNRYSTVLMYLVYGWWWLVVHRWCMVVWW